MALTIPYSFTPSTLISAAQVNANFDAVEAWANGGAVMLADGSVAFTAVPSGPAVNPSAANQLTRKAYVDIPRYVGNTSATSSPGGTGGPGTWLPMSVGWTTATSNRCTGTGNGVTITETGWYTITATASMFGINNTWRGVAIYVNGSKIGSDSHGQGVNGTDPMSQIVMARQLTAGDTVALYHGHDNGPSAVVGGQLILLGIQGTF